ncbi:MAG: TOBE domain-containing protein [Desulfobacterales bacterium]|nr:TOBE domain-containing protein [Desulfobacterales bacterium]
MDLKIGARNQLIGKVTEIKKGDVMSFIRMTIPAESVMGSVITLESLNEMGIKEGDEVKVIVKAVNVLIMKE